jgi:hypothetical protein
LKALEDSVPVLEQFLGLKDALLKNHKFEEPTRNRIIKLTQNKVDAIESGARDVVKYIQTNAPGVPLVKYETELMGGSPSNPAASSTSGPGKQVTLSDGSKMWVGQ